VAQATRAKHVRGGRLHKALMKAALESVFDVGFRATSIESIATKTGMAKTTIYRRWPNKAALVMDAFMARLSSGTSGTPFLPAEKVTDSIKHQMRLMAKAFRGKDGALIKSLLAEAQFDPELAMAFRERWTLPRRKIASEVLHEAIRRGELLPGIDIETTIDLLYAPMYYRLQMGIGPLSEAYIDGLFHHAMQGLACC